MREDGGGYISCRSLQLCVLHDCECMCIGVHVCDSICESMYVIIG